MDTNLLNSKFTRMGARLTIADRPALRRRPQLLLRQSRAHVLGREHHSQSLPLRFRRRVSEQRFRAGTPGLNRAVAIEEDERIGVGLIDEKTEEALRYALERSRGRRRLILVPHFT